MPRRLGVKIIVAVALVLVVTSGTLEAVRSLSSALPFPWTANEREVARLYGAEIPPPYSNTDDVVKTEQGRLKSDPRDAESYVVLGEAYLQKARDTGDPNYYTKADEVLQQATKLGAADAEALDAQGALALARHDFRGALQLGSRAAEIDPYDANALGIVGDSYVELGQYPQAVATFQRMVNLRPDLSSYSRVSYMRELNGDLEGAYAAMQQAAVAGGPAPENVAWTSWQLGTLSFNRGDVSDAQHQFELGLTIVPRYVHSEAGLAAIAASHGDYQTAIADYNTAIDTQPFPLYVIQLGDVYAAAGQSREAAREYGLVDAIERLYQANGVDVDLDLALFDADHQRDLPHALQLARNAVRDRPSVTASDALAWTLYQAGDCAGAAAADKDAMRLGTKLPLMLFHAGMIARCAGDTAAAETYLDETLALNPHFSVLYDGVAQQTLQSMRSGVAAAPRVGTAP